MLLFKEEKKGHFGEVAAEDCIIAALKWPSGQVLESVLATEKGMQDIGCHRAAPGFRFGNWKFFSLRHIVNHASMK